jgi:hypothetical protein
MASIRHLAYVILRTTQHSRRIAAMPYSNQTRGERRSYHTASHIGQRTKDVHLQ